MEMRQVSRRPTPIPWNSSIKTSSGVIRPLEFYGVETDSSLLDHPAFSTHHEVGRDVSMPLKRGDQDPAILAPAAIGAKRIPAEEIQM